jgi:hypothetical protein
LPLLEFNKNGRSADGLASYCRAHSSEKLRANYAKSGGRYNAQKKVWRKENPAAARKLDVRKQLRHHYGLTEVAYEQMFASQRGECAICTQNIISVLGEERVLVGYAAKNVARVDHCHTTGKVRGLLCLSCNTALGQFQDSEKNLLAAARYLRDTSSNRTPQTAQETSRPQLVTLQEERGPFRRDPDQIRVAVRRREELSPF